MSGDEAFVTFVSVLIGVGLVLRGWRRGASLRGPIGRRAILCLAPLAAALGVVVLLVSFAADDVRNDARYLAMYGVMGLAWLGLLRGVVGAFAVDDRVDWIERRNDAAGVLSLAALVAGALAFAGGNFGDGPGWWVVVYASGLATLTLLALWAMLDLAIDVTAQVTIERSLASGVRLGAFLLVVGAVAGRAAAGTWRSLGATNADFVRLAWPLLLLFLVELAIARLARPTPNVPQPSLLVFGLVPAATYLGVGAAYLVSCGWWT